MVAGLSVKGTIILYGIGGLGIYFSNVLTDLLNSLVGGYLPEAISGIILSVLLFILILHLSLLGVKVTGGE